MDNDKKILFEEMIKDPDFKKSLTKIIKGFVTTETRKELWYNAKQELEKKHYIEVTKEYGPNSAAILMVLGDSSEHAEAEVTSLYDELNLQNKENENDEDKKHTP